MTAEQPSVSLAGACRRLLVDASHPNAPNSYSS